MIINRIKRMNVKQIRTLQTSSGRRTRGQRGFTLVELLLVLVILGTLAAIVVPKFSGRTEQARITAALAEGWLMVQKVPPCSLRLPFPLDAGVAVGSDVANRDRATSLLRSAPRFA